MNIGRNEPCPCGSGKKYKKCCLGKDETYRLAEAVMYARVNLKREGRIKQCLHPDKVHCSRKIVKAHAIQNNGVLTKIAENGMLTTLDGTTNLIFQDFDEKGRGVATTFSGFCSYHDKILFQDIEDKKFASTQKQVFLFTYRTAAWHYHKKEEEFLRNKIFRQRMNAKGYVSTDEFDEYMGAVSFGISDNKIKKEKLDKALLANDYSIVNYSIWEIPYEIHFAVSMQHEPTFDLLGNKINDYESTEPLTSIFLNIFPSEGKSYCIWSWLAEDDSVYSSYVSQFMNLKDYERMNFLNNKLPVWTDSIVISPLLWKQWGEDIQQALITHANFDKLYFALELEDGGHPFEYSEIPLDLFEQKLFSQNAM